MNIIGIAGRRDDGSSAGAGKDEVAKFLEKNHDFVIVSFADEIKRTAMRWYDFTPEQLWGSKKEEPDLRYPREHGPWSNVPNAEDGAVVCPCCGVRATAEVWRQPDGMARYAPLPEANLPQCYIVPRFILRFIGTETGRMFWFDTWVRLTLKIANELLIDSIGGHRQVSYHPQIGLFDRGEGNDSHGDRIDGVVIPDVRWPGGNEGQAIKKTGGKLWLVERPGTAQTGTAVAKHASETQPIPDGVFDWVLQNDCSLPALEMKVRYALFESKR
jgi:hypothetical protein